jgi:hypothetical protein
MSDLPGRGTRVELVSWHGPVGTGKSAYEALDAAIDGATPTAAVLVTDAVTRLAALYSAHPHRAAVLVARWLADHPTP